MVFILIPWLAMVFGHRVRAFHFPFPLEQLLEFEVTEPGNYGSGWFLRT